jgi:hypothetical protein
MTEVWNWWQAFEGSVPKGEHPIVTLARAGFIFSNNGDNLNCIQEALTTDGSHPREIQIGIRIIDVIPNKRTHTEEVH